MKKNIWQIITGGICVVLLIVIIVQGKKMDELSQAEMAKITGGMGGLGGGFPF